MYLPYNQVNIILKTEIKLLLQALESLVQQEPVHFESTNSLEKKAKYRCASHCVWQVIEETSLTVSLNSKWEKNQGSVFQSYSIADLETMGITPRTLVWSEQEHILKNTLVNGICEDGFMRVTIGSSRISQFWAPKWHGIWVDLTYHLPRHM